MCRFFDIAEHTSVTDRSFAPWGVWIELRQKSVNIGHFSDWRGTIYEHVAHIFRIKIGRAAPSTYVYVYIYKFSPA